MLTSRLTPALVLLTLLAPAPTASAQFAWPERSENLEVLPETTSAEQLRATMIGFAQALGVRCSHCHDGEPGAPLSTYDFASDVKPMKSATRTMMRMVEAINTTHLADLPEDVRTRLAVTCTTCHRGQPKPVLLEDELDAIVQTEGAEAAAERYRDLRTRFYGGFTYDFRPGTLDRLGQRLLTRGQIDEAQRIFALNVSVYPDHADGYAHLAETYAAKGMTEQAIAFYEKALTLDPTNTDAVARLRALRQP